MTNDTLVREQIAPMLKGKQHERIDVNWELYRHMLGMKFTNVRFGNTQVTRQKLRMVYAQFIARVVANRLES